MFAPILNAILSLPLTRIRELIGNCFSACDNDNKRKPISQYERVVFMKKPITSPKKTISAWALIANFNVVQRAHFRPAERCKR
jgi:hypothetical protein